MYRQPRSMKIHMCCELNLVCEYSKFILKEPPPLSPPSLIHISSLGIMPSCHVSVPSLSDRNTLNDIYHMNSYASFCSRSWMILSVRLGVYAWAAPLISSPSTVNVNVKGASSTSKSSPISSRLRACCFFSLPRYTPECFNHLKC